MTWATKEIRIIKMPYRSKKLNAIPGNNSATKPVTAEAPQIGAPTVHTSIAANPINENKIPIKDVF